MSGYKPKDVFLGAIDLFAILLPGAVLCFFFRDEAERLLPDRARSHAVDWVAFVVASYVLGHLLSLIGDFVLDRMYSRIRPYWFDAGRRNALHARARREVEQLLGGALREDEAPAKWAISAIAVARPELLGQLERKEADQKLFRSLVIAFVAASVRFAVDGSGRGAASLAAGVLALLSLWRFISARVKYTDLAYWRFITLMRCRRAGLVAESEAQAAAAGGEEE